MLYFAYGSNMDWAQMKERCPCAKFVCRAKLPSHRLAFTLRSCRRRCGVADILSDETREVWGVVYELLEIELKNVDRDEDFTRRLHSPARVHPNTVNGKVARSAFIRHPPRFFMKPLSTCYSTPPSRSR